jgi:hypothetical protein
VGRSILESDAFCLACKIIATEVLPLFNLHVGKWVLRLHHSSNRTVIRFLAFAIKQYLNSRSGVVLSQQTEGNLALVHPFGQVIMSHCHIILSAQTMITWH